MTHTNIFFKKQTEKMKHVNIEEIEEQTNEMIEIGMNEHIEISTELTMPIAYLPDSEEKSSITTSNDSPYREIIDLIHSIEAARYATQLTEVVTFMKTEMNEKVDQLKHIHSLKEKQLSLAFMKRLTEIEIDSKRAVEELDIKYMEDILSQRQLTLSQATTIRSQLNQLIDYQTKLANQQTTLIDHQTSLVTCHARLTQSQAQLMHYQVVSYY